MQPTLSLMARLLRPHIESFGMENLGLTREFNNGQHD